MASASGSGSLSLKWLVSRRLGFEMREVVELVGKNGVKQLSIDQVRIEDAAALRLRERRLHLRLREPLEKELRELNMWELFSAMEMPLVPVLARMEAEGIAMDVSVLREMSQGLNEQIAVPRDPGLLRGRPRVQPGLAAAALDRLFEELGLPKTRKTKQGYSHRRPGYRSSARRPPDHRYPPAAGAS